MSILLKVTPSEVYTPKGDTRQGECDRLSKEVERLKKELEAYVTCSICGEALRMKDQTTVAELMELIAMLNKALLPCIFTRYSSRVCTLGTKSCVANHEV